MKNIHGIPESQLEERAICAHLRFCHNNGFIADQPSPDNTVIRGNHVIVANSHRELGRYRIGKSGAGSVTLRRV